MTLVTHLAHQAQEVRSALIHWATSTANADVVPCWIESSSIAQGAYHHAGFRRVDSLEINPREFDPGGKEANRVWEICKFVYIAEMSACERRISSLGC